MSNTPLPIKAVDTSEEKLAGCQLGRELGNCPLYRVGCGSMLEVMRYLWPPYTVTTWAREHLSSDRDAQQWLQRLDNALPGQRPAFDQRRRG